MAEQMVRSSSPDAAAVHTQRQPSVGHWIPLPYDGGLSLLLPTAYSISIGVPPQFLGQHDRLASQNLRSAVRRVGRLVVTALFIERVGLFYKELDFIRILSRYDHIGDDPNL
jgi:hypothetical protein